MTINTQTEESEMIISKRQASDALAVVIHLERSEAKSYTVEMDGYSISKSGTEAFTIHADGKTQSFETLIKFVEEPK